MIELFVLDLREDRGYLADHMGSNVISYAEVWMILCIRFSLLFYRIGEYMFYETRVGLKTCIIS